ncbi:MAG: endonuclease [Bacilli bacterium]|nr:endonuclease [Bacilli bacterium]
MFRKIRLLAAATIITTACIALVPRTFAATSYSGKAYNSSEKIDLSSSTTAEIEAYYLPKNAENLIGDDLMKYLYNIISKNNYFLDYGTGLNGVGRWYQITDRNYHISKEINPDTFKFLTSGKSAEASTFYLNNMYISKASNNDTKKAFSNCVNGYSVDANKKYIDYTAYSKPNNNIQVDKEHVWAKNHGFKVKDSKGQDVFVKGAPTDLHHLVAADHNTNSAGHNDYFYGDIDQTQADKEGSNIKSIKAYLADGSEEVSGWLYTPDSKDSNSNIFEPTDEWKGNIARCLFYMATRYSNKKDVNTQAEPYLKLTDDRNYTDDNNEIFHGVQYNLSTLLDWNELDPVDDDERYRNDLIYHNVQRNRNPYIDYPELARKVFDPYSAKTNYNFDKLESTYTVFDQEAIDFDISLPDEAYYTAEVIPEVNPGAIKLSNNNKGFIATQPGKATIKYTIKVPNQEEKVFTTVVTSNKTPSSSQKIDTQYLGIGDSYQIVVDESKVSDLPAQHEWIYLSNDEKVANVEPTGKVSGANKGIAEVIVGLPPSYKTSDSQIIPVLRFSVLVDSIDFFTDVKPSYTIRKGETIFLVLKDNYPTYFEILIKKTFTNQNIVEYIYNGAVSGLDIGNTALTFDLNLNGKTYNKTVNLNVVESPSLEDKLNETMAVQVNSNIDLSIPRDKIKNIRTDDSISYSTSNDKIVKIDQEGHATCVGTGTSTIVINLVNSSGNVVGTLGTVNIKSMTPIEFFVNNVFSNPIYFALTVLGIILVIGLVVFFLVKHRSKKKNNNKNSNSKSKSKNKTNKNNSKKK